MSTSALDAARRPLPSLPPMVWWTLDASGVFLRLDGPAAELARAEIGGRFAGRHHADLFPEGEPVRDFLVRALEGRTLAERLSWRGLEWFSIAEPLWDDDGLAGVEGVSLRLPDGVEAAGPGETEGLRFWTVGRSIRRAHAFLLPGDIMCFDGDEYTYTRGLDRPTAEAIRRQHEGAALLPYESPSDVSPPPAESGPVSLRLVE